MTGKSLPKLVACVAVVTLSLLSGGTASAGVILNPNLVINNTMGQFAPNFAVNKLLDQSGLSANYVSGVTDFATYIGSGPTHTRSPDTNGWLSSGPNVLPGVIDFDLGAVFGLTQLAYWNHAAGSSANVQNFRVFTSNVADFSVSTLVGNFVNPQQNAFNPYPAQVYDIADTNARYVRLALDTYYGNPCCVAIGEIAFDSVPEPSTLTLLGFALVGLGLGRRRASR
jgi:hypothetical protein